MPLALRLERAPAQVAVYCGYAETPDALPAINAQAAPALPRPRNNQQRRRDALLLDLVEPWSQNTATTDMPVVVTGSTGVIMAKSLASSDYRPVMRRLIMQRDARCARCWRL